VTPAEFGGLPWAALLLGADGRLLAASLPAADLLGFTPATVESLEERLEVRSSAGVLQGAALPWRRAPREDRFEESEVWIDVASGRRLPLWIECRSIGAQRVLALHAGGVRPLERRSDAFVRALNETVLARPQALHLRDLLRRLVEQACELTGARYGAMGVLRPDHTDLKDFVFVGLSEDEARPIGRLPAGKGLLGAVVSEGRTIKIPRLADDPRAAGFPEHHPPMGSFLGVPLRIGEEVFGNFYLTKDEGAGEFSDEDARIVEGLSAQAALTVAFARQVEEERRQVFEAVVREAPHGIAFFPADPREEVYGNPAAERLLGRLTRSDDPDRTCDIAHPDGHVVPPDEAPWNRALRGESVLNVPLLVARPGERPTHVLASAAPVRAEGAAMLGAVLVLQDVTSLVDLARLREEFAAVVAHDLRTPVQAVLMQVEKLLGVASGEATSVPVSTLQSMRHSGRRLSRLISDLLDASLIEARRLRVSARPVDVPEVVSRLVEQVSILLHGHAVHVEVRGEPPKVHADPVRIEQILSNLLENAAKYSDEGKPIRVVVEPANGGTAISVQDVGQGIDPADMPRLFDRYYQAQRSREKQSGSGLGLYVVKGLVAAHEGKLAVESTPGVGSVFRIWLPGAKAA
jgi:signal transduction histidine kinase